jgi:PadR family transcriptional regulator, regulatory protein PadR
MLTKLEEFILLSVWRLGDNAYGATIFKHICDSTEKTLSLGGVYFPLERLARQGHLQSYTGETTLERKGLSRRYYKLTRKGMASLEELKRVNQSMWSGFPGYAAESKLSAK